MAPKKKKKLPLSVRLLISDLKLQNKENDERLENRLRRQIAQNQEFEAHIFRLKAELASQTEELNRAQQAMMTLGDGRLRAGVLPDNAPQWLTDLIQQFPELYFAQGLLVDARREYGTDKSKLFFEVSYLNPLMLMASTPAKDAVRNPSARALRR